MNISLSKYKSDRILEPTEVTKVICIEMENLDIERRQKSQNDVMPCKIVSVFLSTLVDCKCPVLLDFATCTNFSAVTIEM